MKTVTVRLEIRKVVPKGYFIIVNGRINGRPVRLILDTGASHCFIDTELIRQLEDAKIKPTNKNEIKIGIGGNDIESDITRINELKLGRAQFPAMEVHTLDLSNVNESYRAAGYKPIQGILGCDFLYRHNAVIDMQKRQLTLDK